MHGFKIAIATKDKAPEDLITMGTDIIASEPQSEMDDAEASIIDYVDIFFDTTDNDVKQKSGSMLAKVEIRGNIPQAPELMKKFRKLSEWAHDRSAETTYRDICIAVKSAENSFQVVYTLKNVFVVDYREIYKASAEEGSDRFELRLTQRDNNMDKIDIVSDWPTDWEWARKG